MSVQPPSAPAEPPSSVPSSTVDSPANAHVLPDKAAVEALLHAAAAHETPGPVPPALIARTLMRVRQASRRSADSGVNMALT